MPVREFTEWSITATADNAAATVTRAAETGRQHFITSISGSFSVAQTAAKNMTLKDGTTTIGNFHVFQVRDVTPDKPVRITVGAAVELSLPASGTAAQIGAVTLMGFTI